MQKIEPSNLLKQKGYSTLITHFKLALLIFEIIKIIANEYKDMQRELFLPPFKFTSLSNQS